MTGTISRAAVAAALGAVLLTGCAAKPALTPHAGTLQVVTTTGLLRDLVIQVGGERVEVAAIVPDGADPHSYEPTLRDARNVVYADVAFSNYALLEEHGIVKAIDANLRADALNVALAEDAVKYAADIIPLIENANLDTVWLGLRVHGDGRETHGATRSSQVVLTASAVEGPGDVFAYLTGAFGQTEVYIDSSDGLTPIVSPGAGAAASAGRFPDTMTLPVGAHTHLSWAFTDPGVYHLTLGAYIQVADTAPPIPLDTATVTIAVGVDPTEADDGVRLVRGHVDLTANLDTGRLEVRHDPEGHDPGTQRTYRPDAIVLVVPPKALTQIPAGPQHTFMGTPGTEVYQLPQAVLGKHVHGEIDPHLWQNVRNAMAYVHLIRDTLVAADPAGARVYAANATAYLAELEDTDTYVRHTIGQIPPARRHLVTTHDAFAYLADAYDIEIAGFVTPNPAVDPSLTDRRTLVETIRTLKVPAVFLEPNLAARASTLTEVATDLGVRVCPIYGDTLDTAVASYTAMMRFNAASLHDCLTEPDKEPAP
ncbi:MAG: anchored repeat ABC transporter, substrate-binding protein [Bifidobacteriaceae bacterium]|jgi:anchored repeat ABC transporter substrate-binding protein|nr:anchored repeat ABC transporter, substrate-binding protein [Bifidobacteriaceae bacterium]